MAHIFISYSSKHRELTEELAEYLSDCGLEVYWDTELSSLKEFDWQLNEKLRLAGAVVVLWTDGAVISPWVRHEVDIGAERQILVHARAVDLDPAKIPEAFRKFDAHKFGSAQDEREKILKDLLAVREGRLLLEAKDDEPPANLKPTDLLQARYGLVKMTGAEDRIQDLIDWATDDAAYAARPARAAGRLIHGPGGLGKTRLLIEVAARMRASGWSAGFVARPPVEAGQERRDRYDTAIGHLIRGATDKGLLLVMDYAEGRDAEIDALAQRILQRPADDHRPIRLVLLTRAAGDWWQRVSGHDAVQTVFGAGHGPGDIQQIPGITSGRDRLDLFLAAVDAFKPRLIDMGYAMPVAGNGPPETWEITRALGKRLEVVESNAGYKKGEGYDRPLAIQMEALLFLASQPPGANEPGVAPLLTRIIDLERQHWPKLVGKLDGLEGRLPIRHMERAVAQATGVLGVPAIRSAEELFMADKRYPERQGSRGSVEKLTETVGLVYGRTDGGIAHLEPDLIGEHLVAGTADLELIDGCVAWIEAQPEANRADLRARLVTVLQRASQSVHGPRSDGATALLDHLIDNHGGRLGAAVVSVMGDTPGKLFDRLQAKVDTLDPNTLAAVNFALPVQNVAWMELSLRVAERFAELARDWKSTANAVDMSGAQRDTVLNSAAAGLGTLGIRLSNLGRREDALKASQEAVDIYRALAKDRPDDAFLGPTSR